MTEAQAAGDAGKKSPKRKPVSLRNVERSDELFDKDQALAAEGQWDRALELVERAVKLDPGFAEAHNLAGDLLVKKCLFDEALERFRRACELKPDVELYLFDLASALAFTGRHAEAAEVYRRCLELEPAHGELYAGYGTTLLELGDASQAAAFLRRGIAHDPSDLAARFHLGRALLALGRGDEARREFERAMEGFRSFLVVNPRGAEGYYFLGVSLACLGHLEEAAANLKRAIELDTPEIDYHAGFGLTYHDFDAHYRYALVLRDLGRREEALRQCDRALEIRPASEAARRLRGELAH